MYRIAMGDDDPEFLKSTERLAAAAMDADGLVRGVDYDVACFRSAPLLREALSGERDRCQMLLLDVEFGRDNGLDLAASLRKTQDEFSLIYITSYRDYVFDSFDTRPLHYLLKPVDGERLAALIREDYRRRYLDARLYLKAGGRHTSLAFSDIYAAEAARHRVLLHLKDHAEEWRGSLHSLAPRLPGWRFCQCHNSYLVNLSHVTELVRYEARLDNGMAVPVSKRFYRSAIDQYIAFLKN